MATHTKADGTVLNETDATVYALETARAALKSDAPFWSLAIEQAKVSGLDSIVLLGQTGCDGPMTGRFFVEQSAKHDPTTPFRGLCSQFVYRWFEVVRPGEVLRYGADHWAPATD